MLRGEMGQEIEPPGDGAEHAPHRADHGDDAGGLDQPPRADAEPEKCTHRGTPSLLDAPPGAPAGAALLSTWPNPSVDGTHRPQVRASVRSSRERPVVRLASTEPVRAHDRRSGRQTGQTRHVGRGSRDKRSVSEAWGTHRGCVLPPRPSRRGPALRVFPDPLSHSPEPAPNFPFPRNVELRRESVEVGPAGRTDQGGPWPAKLGELGAQR